MATESQRSEQLAAYDGLREQAPLRVFFGSAPLGSAEADYESRLAT